jgi:hypothetical protein
MPVTVIEKLGLKKRYQALPKDAADSLHPSATGVFNKSENTLVEGDKSDPTSSPALAPPLPLDIDSGVLKSSNAGHSSAPNGKHIPTVSSDLPPGVA